MMTTSPILIAFTILALAASAAATTTNTRRAGYTFASDVTGYMNMTLDTCEIQAALMAGDNAAALEIFKYGKNSFRGGGYRYYYSWASAVHTGQLYYDLLMGNLSANFYPEAFTSAVNKSQTSYALTLLGDIQIKYMMHEMDSAVTNTEAGMTADATGAPHNLDEAWGIWAGSADFCSGVTLLDKAQAVAEALQVTYAGQSTVNLALASSMSDALWGARLNMTETVSTARTEIAASIKVYLLQTIHAHAYAAAMAHTCNDHNMTMAAQEVSIAAIDILAPLLEAQGIHGRKLTALVVAVTAETTDLTQVQKAIRDIVDKLPGMELWQVGTPDMKWFVDNMGLCSASRR